MGEFEDLIKKLKYGDDLTRYDAAVALGRLGDNRAVEPLTKALKSQHPHVREAAGRALEEIKKRAQI